MIVKRGDIIQWKSGKAGLWEVVRVRKKFINVENMSDLADPWNGPARRSIDRDVLERDFRIYNSSKDAGERDV